MNRNLAQLVKFAVVGAVNTGVDFLLFYISYRLLYLPLLFSNLVGYGAAVINSFFLNSLWTFKAEQSSARRLNFGRFVLINGVGFLISSVVVLACSQIMAAEFAKLSSIVLTLFWNFLVTKRFGFAGVKADG
ncbi:GtrA family protein [Rhizobium sp. CFBP 8762]|uniref:GtrA family protein n=1 Tax=Rhizobium sp. CFBP 8762 TaxID=2775279 RepID=UPI00178507FE|nr:GtrA family protein [Rhizobium sp. CFBP 8762]MBD8554664.1 GtrA family protein [Rhizobium sp. CFBP 8762]